MKLPTKIMVPVDRSDRSERALDYAVAVAERLGAQLVLMMNVDLPQREVLEPVAAAQGLSISEAAKAALDELADKHRPNAPVEVVVRFHASPADGILHAATETGADAIILGSHGRSGMSRWMLGSVAEKVARGATVPVTIVPVRD